MNNELFEKIKKIEIQYHLALDELRSYDYIGVKIAQASLIQDSESLESLESMKDQYRDKILRAQELRKTVNELRNELNKAISSNPDNQ